MKILAIDPATACGFAYSNGASGVWDLSVRKDESSGMRLIRFEAKILEVINTVGVDVIAFETPTVAQGKKANMDGLKLQTKMQAIVERLAEQTPGLEYVGYNLQTIKSFALPPNAPKRNKEAMVAAAIARWPDVDIIDNNQADALWLLALAQRDLGGES